MQLSIVCLQLLGQEGLGDEVLGALANGLGDHLRLDSRRRNDHDLGLRVEFEDMLQGVQPVGSRHDDVQCDGDRGVALYC